LKQVILLLILFGVSTAGTLASSQQPSGTTPQATRPPNDQFPQGPGRDTFLRVCSRCHSPTNVLADGQSRQGWEDTITKMVGYGAMGTDEEFTAVLDYLAANFPLESSAKVNVNQAAAEQLEKELLLSEKDAQAIIEYRTANGNFKSFDDLKRVPGIDQGKLEAKKSILIFQSLPAPSPQPVGSPQ
jgi:competence protein ComEA